MNYSGKLRQRIRSAGGGHLSSSGAPPLGLAVLRRPAPFARVQPLSAKRGVLPSPIHSPQTPGLGCTPSCLPVSDRKRLDSAFSSRPTSCRWRRRRTQSGGSRPRQWGLLGSWRGRTMTTPWVQPEDGQCMRAQGAPDPWRAFLALIRDLRGLGPALSASPSPRTLTWLGRPGSLPGPEGLWRLCPPGRPRQGLGLPAGLHCVPGLGTGDSGAPRKEPPWPHSPRPVSASFPAGGSSNEFQMRSAQRGAREGGGGGGAQGPFVRTPTSSPALSRPLPVRTGQRMTSRSPVLSSRSCPGGLNLR